MAISTFATQEGPVGLFWDLDSIPSLDEHDMSTLLQKIQEFGGVLSGGKGFSVQFLCHHNPKNSEYFRKFGFEVIDQDGESWPALDSGVNSVVAKILLWLWDAQREAADATARRQDSADRQDDETSSVLSAPAKPEKAPTIFLISGNDFLAPFLSSLKQRDVNVILLSPFASKPNPALRRACSSALDLKQFLQGIPAGRHAGEFTPQSSLESVITEEEIEQDAAVEQFVNQKDDEQFAEPSPTSMEWSPTPRAKTEQAPTSRQVVPPLAISAVLNSARETGDSARENADQGVVPSEQQRRALPPNSTSRFLKEEEIAMDSPRSLDGYINKDDDNDTVLLQEQRILHDELVTAIYMNNVKAAVATLRKMYTRQSRSFRIPALLSSIMPDTAAMLEDNQVELFHVSVKFSLDCIQWCFGVQRGENVESFKYKMNKNIARWILKETQRKGLTNPASQYTIGVGVALVKALLVDTTELEFALDILTCLNVPQPLQYFVPYVTAWTKAPPSFQQHLDLKSLQKFVYEHPELQTIAQRGLPHDVRDQGGGSIASTSSPALSSHSNTNSSGSGNSYLPMSGRSWDDNQGAYAMSDPRKRDVSSEEWIRDSSGSTQQGAREHMLYHLNEYGDHLSGGASGMKQMDRPGYGYNTSSQPLESKLLKLLMRSVKGELGARIPALYRDEYGEPLRLRGRKLKDILLETGLVEMVGSDGPGDKLFRIIGNSSGDSALDLGVGQSKDGSHMRGNDVGTLPGYRTQTRSFDNSQMSRDGGMDSYRAGAPRSDRSDAGGMDHRHPFVPSLLSDDYPVGLNSFVKNREGGGDSFSSQEYGSVGRRHNEEMYGSRLPMQTQQPQHLQHLPSHQYPLHQQSQQQQQQHQQLQHQQQNHHHQLHSEVGASMMYSSFSNSHSEDFTCESRPPRDGGDYVKRLYEERGLSQSSSSSSFIFESGATPVGGSGPSSLGGDTGGGSGTLSELNMDSIVLGEDSGASREEFPK